jgi:hypothetical protein
VAWAEQAATVITKHLKGAEPVIMANQVFPAMLMKKGRIKYNCAGTDFDWPVRFRRRRGMPIADTEEVTLSRVQQHRRAKLDYKAYVLSDLYTKLDALANRTPESLTALLSNNTESLIDDLKVDFGRQLMYNGDSTGNTQRITGYNSIFKHAGTASVNPLVADNNGSYAQLNLARQAYGGTWSVASTWPLAGWGTEEYDFWTPLIINYTSASWANGATWANNCLEVLGYLTSVQLRHESKEDRIELIMLDLTLFNDFKTALRLKERINVTSTSSDVYQLGFTEAIDFDGTSVLPSVVPQPGQSTTDPVGFGINFSTMELMSMQSQLFVADSEPISAIRRTGAITADFMGNLRIRRPRTQAKLEKIS